MICGMSGGHLMMGRAGVQGTFHAVVTKIHANVAVGVSSGWEGVMDKDPEGRGSDSLSSSMTGGIGEEGHEESQRAKGMAVEEVVFCCWTCSK